MKTTIFLKMVRLKKVKNSFSFPTVPIKALACRYEKASGDAAS
jgi:hypothetical protein